MDPREAEGALELVQRNDDACWVQIEQMVDLLASKLSRDGMKSEADALERVFNLLVQYRGKIRLLFSPLTSDEMWKVEEKLERGNWTRNVTLRHLKWLVSYLSYVGDAKLRHALRLLNVPSESGVVAEYVLALDLDAVRKVLVSEDMPVRVAVLNSGKRMVIFENSVKFPGIGLIARLNVDYLIFRWGERTFGTDIKHVDLEKQIGLLSLQDLRASVGLVLLDAFTPLVQRGLDIALIIMSEYVRATQSEASNPLTATLSVSLYMYFQTQLDKLKKLGIDPYKLIFVRSPVAGTLRGVNIRNILGEGELCGYVSIVKMLACLIALGRDTYSSYV